MSREDGREREERETEGWKEKAGEKSHKSKLRGVNGRKMHNKQGKDGRL